MSGDVKTGSFSENLMLDNTEEGVVIKGIKDHNIAKKSGLKEGDEIVAATVHLDHLDKKDVLKILKVLEPYDDNMKVVTKQELNASAGLGSLGANLRGPAEMLKKDFSLDTSAESSLDGLNGKLNAAQGLGGEISGHTLNGDLPSLTLNEPLADGGAKLKASTLGMTVPNIKGADIDGTLNAPDISIPSPQLNTPSASLDISKPEVKTGALKYKAPQFKMPQFTLPELEVPKGETNVSGDAGIEAPSGKVRLPTLQKPKFHLPGAKVKTPDVDLNTDVKSPDLSLSPPEFGTSLHGSDVGLDLPSAHVDKPELNLKSPNVDTGSPSGKFKWPTFKKRKLTGPKLKGPDVDLDADISAPDLNLSAPKIDGEVNAPDVNLNLPKTDLEDPKLDINAPDIEGPHGKFKWFSLKKPKFGTLRGPKADVDADVNVPDLDLKCPDVDLTAADLSLSASAPKVEGGIDAPDMDIVLPKADLKAPNVDLLDTDVDASAGKFKFPKMKLPKFGFGGTKMRGPDLDTDINPDVDVSILNVDAKPPTADLNLPNVDVNTPDLNLPSPKLKGDVAAPDLNLSLPKTDLKAPDLSLSAPTLKGGIDAPNLDIDLPKADLKNPNVDLPDPDVDVSGGKFKFPKIKLPKFDFGEAKMKGPDLAVDTDINPDLDVSGCFASPNVDAQLPTADLKLPNVDVNTPDLNLPSPKFKGPEVVVPDLNLSLPKADLKSPDLSLSAPKPEAGLVTKNLDINLPKANFKGLQAPDAQLKTPHLDDPLGDFRMPHFKVPKLGLSSPEANVGTLTTDANISVPSVDGEISSPNVSVPAANTSLNKPDLSITAEGDANVKNSPKSKLRWPFKWGLTSSSNDEDGNGVDSESDVPSPNLEVPTFKLHKLPRSNFDEIGGLVDGIGIPKTDTQAKDYMISKGVRLPIVNAASNIGEKVDIMERLKLAKEKPTANISPTEAKTDVDLKGGIAAPSLDVSASSEPGDSSLLRGGTFKVVKPEPGLGLEIPTVSSSDENDKLSLSLSNMLGLNVKDQNTD
ncbi:hypothetical protein LDENG_00040910 [Lucifuga dentata]|nr:hypothetical protein LDENG_00040910 [Lucifuga dentata]